MLCCKCLLIYLFLLFRENPQKSYFSFFCWPCKYKWHWCWCKNSLLEWINVAISAILIVLHWTHYFCDIYCSQCAFLRCHNGVFPDVRMHLTQKVSCSFTHFVNRQVLTMLVTDSLRHSVELLLKNYYRHII